MTFDDFLSTIKALTTSTDEGVPRYAAEHPVAKGVPLNGFMLDARVGRS